MCNNIYSLGLIFQHATVGSPLEGPRLSAGLRTPWSSSGWAGGGDKGQGSLDISETVAPATRRDPTRISCRRWLDGWMLELYWGLHDIRSAVLREAGNRVPNILLPKDLCNELKGPQRYIQFLFWPPGGTRASLSPYFDWRACACRKTVACLQILPTWSNISIHLELGSRPYGACLSWTHHPSDSPRAPGGNARLFNC